MTAPILHHYHPFTKEYVGSSAARENPLEKGKFLYPKNSTLVDIVDIPKGSVAVFDGTSWDIVKDNRGVIYYDIDGNKFIHNDLSEIPVWSIPIYPQETDENHNLFSIYNPASGKIKKIHFLPAKMWMNDNGWYELDETEPDKTIIQYAEKIGYEKIGGKYKIKWSIKDKTSQEQDSSKKSVLDAYYKKKMYGGIKIPGGINVGTGKDDISLINAATLRAVLDNDDTLEYEYFPSTGGVITITNAKFIEIALAVASHFDKCRKAREMVSLSLGTLTSDESIKGKFNAEYARA